MQFSFPQNYPSAFSAEADEVLMELGVWLHLTERHEHRHVHDKHHQHTHPPGTDPTEPHTHEHIHEPMTHPHFPNIHNLHIYAE